jgi:hypothetical protein
LKSFIPSLINSLSSSSVETKIETIHTLSKIATFPNTEVGRYSEDIIRKLKPLLEDKKRVVRKFARNCINEWASLK